MTQLDNKINEYLDAACELAEIMINFNVHHKMGPGFAANFTEINNRLLELRGDVRTLAPSQYKYTGLLKIAL